MKSSERREWCVSFGLGDSVELRDFEKQFETLDELKRLRGDGRGDLERANRGTTK